VEEPEATRVVEPEPRGVEPVETTYEPEPVETTQTVPEPEPEPVGTTIRGPLFADEAWDADEDIEPTQVVPLGDLSAAADPAGRDVAPEPEPAPVGQREPGFDTGPIWVGRASHVEEDAPLAPEDHAREPRPGWFVPALLGGLVLALLLGAYLIGLVFSSTVGDADVQTEGPERVVMGDDAESGDKQGDGKGKPPAQKEAPDAYQGTVEITPIGGASASCQSPSSVDAAGNEIGYPPTSAYDGDLTTAWRCNGTGVGQTLSLTFAEPVEVGEVGLVPGYAKTDPASGVDRYAENNRITRVRWTFPDGTSVVQRLDGSPTNRSMQSLRVKPVQADSVMVEVLRTVRGARNTVAVSEVQIGRTVG
jgi:hypothetical protein